MTKHIIITQGRKVSWRTVNGKVLDSSEKLHRKYKATMRNIADFTAIIASPHRWHITLLLPGGGENWEEDIKTIKKFLKEFGKRFAKKFPNGWYIHKLEYSHSPGIHLHILARLGEKKPLEEVSTGFANWWRKITGSKETGLCHVEPYSIHQFGYMTSPKKRQDTMFLLSQLKGQHIWGVVNKKAIKLAEAHEYQVNREEFDTFRDNLSELLDEATTSESHRAYLDNDNGSLYYVGKKIQEKALKDIIAKGRK